MIQQEITSKNTKMTFRDYFFTLPDTSPRVDIRDLICEKLDMPKATLYDKIRNSRFTMAEKILIAEMVGEPIETLFPEEL
jgi:hypothetical protein